MRRTEAMKLPGRVDLRHLGVVRNRVRVRDNNIIILPRKVGLRQMSRKRAARTVVFIKYVSWVMIKTRPNAK